MNAIPSLVLATRNPHKVREIARLLEPSGITVEPLPSGIELPPEVGATFEANALPKAAAASAATGPPAIADDSGIEAEALGGRPGVHSARYAGPEATDQQNLEKLMREAPAGSGLRYVCALAYVEPGGNTGGAGTPRGADRAGGGGNPRGTDRAGGADAAEKRVFFGYCAGRLAPEARGSGGFGYDPAFLPDELADGRTMAELSDPEKDAISHRGHAVRELAQWLSR
jgi:XTP/dITP diphosphohydrolase